MGSVRYTKEQENAINLRDRNMIVSAAAGTGKTSVLVERVIRLLLDKENPVDIDRMLVVTFTNAAAAEMKERIREALQKRVIQSPSDKRLREQLALIGQAGISTIHSFCSDVIKSNYHVLDIDPSFKVADELESKMLLDEAVENIMEDGYENRDAAFVDLADGFGKGRDDSALTDILKSLYFFMRSMPGYLDWVRQKAEMYNFDGEDFGETQWGRELISFAKVQIDGSFSALEDVYPLVECEEDFEGYARTIETDLENVTRLYEVFKEGSWDDCVKALSEFSFPRLANAARGADQTLKTIVQDARNSAKKGIGRLSEFMSANSALILENMKELQPVIACLADMAIQLDGEYTEMKNKKGLLDYNDLEHYALECLKGETGSMYREKFREVLVDEYQDINPIQEEIIKNVSGRNANAHNVFMVGDVKQSIYGFRQAMPSLFIEKYRSYSTDTEEENVRIELFRNYRSRRNILDFTNYVFSKIMTQETGGIEYTDEVALKPGDDVYKSGQNQSHSVEVRLVCGEDGDLFTEDISKNQKEAAVVGDEIRNLFNMGFEVEDKNTGKPRPLEYRDIAILMRSPKSGGAEYVKKLKSSGIPVFAESDSDFFKEREILVMTSFLEILDNPIQDIPLLTVLRSSIYDFSDKELALIRQNLPGTSFHEALTEYKGLSGLEEKIDGFQKIFTKYREDAKTLPVHKLLWNIMQETGYYFKAPYETMLESKQANLRKLFELACDFDKSSMTGLFAFINYLKNYKDKSGSGDSIAAHGESSNAVRIISIHKSKGLEFPVVILAGTGKNFNRSESRESVTFDRELGFGPNYYNNKQGYWFPTAAKRAIQVKNEKDGIEEEMRILYVALTRAREKLIITGYVTSAERSAIRWVIASKTLDQTIRPGKIMGASGMLDWIIPCLTAHSRGESVCEVAGLDIQAPVTGGPAFNLSFVYAEDIHQIMDYAEPSEKSTSKPVDLDYGEINRRFGWRYGYEEEAGIHKKVSVTELNKLSGAQAGEMDIFSAKPVEKPAFMEREKDLAGAEKGTVLHNLFSSIDITAAGNEKYVGEFLTRSGIENALHDEALEMITNFFNGGLGLRIKNSNGVMREKSFLLPMETVKIYPEYKGRLNKNHTTLVQGVVDCIFHEEDGLVIVDYKSDKVEPGKEDEYAQRYRTQLELYAEAVSKLTKKPVKEKYLYFLKTGRAVRI